MQTGWIGRRGVLALGGVALLPARVQARTAAGPSIIGAIDWGGAKAQFFFADGSYERFDLAAGSVDDGYPRPVDNASWPGLGDFAGDITAACDGPGAKSYFFLSGARYVRYDATADRVDPGYPRPVNDTTWPGLGASAGSLISALNWKNGKIQFFFSDGTYIRYDVAADRADAGYPQAIDDRSWPGLADYRDRLAGAFNVANRKAYFFLSDGGVIRYDIEADRADKGFPRMMSPQNPLMS